jgi:hypothetical protein
MNTRATAAARVLRSRWSAHRGDAVAVRLARCVRSRAHRLVQQLGAAVLRGLGRGRCRGQGQVAFSQLHEVCAAPVRGSSQREFSDEPNLKSKMRIPMPVAPTPVAVAPLLWGLHLRPSSARCAFAWRCQPNWSSERTAKQLRCLPAAQLQRYAPQSRESA